MDRRARTSFTPGGEVGLQTQQPVAGARWAVRPGSSRRMLSRNSPLSASSRSAISASIAAHSADHGRALGLGQRLETVEMGIVSKPSSATLATCIAGLMVSRHSGAMISSRHRRDQKLRTGSASLRWGSSFSSTAASFCASLSPAQPSCSRASGFLGGGQVGERRFDTDRLDVGDRIDVAIPAFFTVLVLETTHPHSRSRRSRGYWPGTVSRPSPLGAGHQSAISTNSTIAGWIFCGNDDFRKLREGRGSAPRQSRRSGSMVAERGSSRLRSGRSQRVEGVDFPTLGRPTVRI